MLQFIADEHFRPKNLKIIDVYFKKRLDFAVRRIPIWKREFISRKVSLPEMKNAYQCWLLTNANANTEW